MTDRRALSRHEAAARLGISVRHLFDLVREHSVPVLRPGRRVLFDEVALAILERSIRCPCASNAEKTLARFGLSEPSVPPAPRKASAFAAALALTTPPRREKKPPSWRQRSSEAPGTVNVLSIAASRRR